jgi:uncharacterized protein (DUF2164 family)
MPIDLDPDAKQQALASIKRFLLEELDQDVGDLKAGVVLQFVLEELAPVAYNRGVADAQRFFQDRAVDLEGACHEKEFGYWNKGPDRPRRGRG